MPFRASSDTGVSTGNNLTNPTITLPTTGPGGDVAVGDVAVVFIAASVTTGLTAPAGWTEHEFTLASGQMSLHSWWKVIDADDAGSVVTFTGTSQQRRSLACAVFSGINTTTPISGDTPAGIGYATTATNRDAPDATLTGVRDVISAVASRAAVTDWGIPSGFTTGPESYNTGSGGAELATAYIESAPSGALDGGTWTGNASQGGAAVQLLALNLAAAAAAAPPPRRHPAYRLLSLLGR